MERSLPLLVPAHLAGVEPIHWDTSEGARPGELFMPLLALGAWEEASGRRIASLSVPREHFDWTSSLLVVDVLRAGPERDDLMDPDLGRQFGDPGSPWLFSLEHPDGSVSYATGATRSVPTIGITLLHIDDAFDDVVSLLGAEGAIVHTPMHVQVITGSGEWAPPAVPRPD